MYRRLVTWSVTWAVVVTVSTVGLLLSSVPAAQAQTAQDGSPCGSETVVPRGQDALRADCEVLWDFYTKLEDPGALGDPGPG